MAAIPALDEEESYLAAILDDPSGIELAEFCWIDETPGKPDPCFRVWDFQWTWYNNESTYQIDQAGRSLGKSMGILMRAFAFVFNYPGQEMLITAPELNHLGPIVDKVEDKFLNIRLGREMLPRQKGGGIKHQPQFQLSATNGAVIMGRLPQRDGKGVKGQHPLVLECFPASILILTDRGQVPISEVVVGDQVLTHQGRFMPVTGVFDRGVREAVTVRGQGHPGLTVTPDHPFWGAPRLPSRTTRALGPAQWIKAQELTGQFWSSPEQIPVVKAPSVIPRACSGASSEIAVDTLAFAWAMGCWLAEGSTSAANKGGRRNKVSWSVHRLEVDEVMIRLREAGMRPFAQPCQASAEGFNVVVGAVELGQFVNQHFGSGARGKTIPTWVYGKSRAWREAFLNGLVFGDGFHDPDTRYAAGRWKVSTASWALAVGLRLLALGLGLHVSVYRIGERKSRSFIKGVEVKSGVWFQVVANTSGQLIRRDGLVLGGVREVKPTEPQRMYDLAVANDHSFVADGIVVHNSDEMQDYPRQGWMELIETMKATVPGAQWRAHGVSRGVRDEYYRMTENKDPDLPWYVHRYMAMHRPSWADAERRSKIAIYGGSRDNPDYKRNIYGEHGDVTNPVFVLARLMACVRINESTWATEYNENVYAKIKLEYERIENSGMPIEAHLKLPANHLLPAYRSYWAGMDIGYTNDPSELLVFGLLKVGDRDVMRLLSRIHMMRITAMDQAAVIKAAFRFYGPRLKALSLDKTGNGLPIWQETMRGGRLHSEAPHLKGYGFSEKKAVEFDDRPLERRERPQDAVIEKNVIEYATDELRTLVDGKMMELPFDQELLTEFQGQTVVYGGRDEGVSHRRNTRYGGGSFHTLDAAKLAVLGKSLEMIEATLNKPRRNGPVLDQFGV